MKWTTANTMPCSVHANRRVIFVGDFIDRGPQQSDVLHIEFNALCWAEPDENGGFLRAHTQKNFGQHEEFRRQIGEGSDPHSTALDWFRQPRTSSRERENLSPTSS
jgi:hypothetical protein